MAGMLVMLTGLPILAAQETDLPPVGRSRFDELIGAGPVPFPFSSLLARLRSQLRPDPSGLPTVKTVLIPLGRSLQRVAGAPDFFRFPRVVAAVDTETKPGVAPMRDRLFLGYHEKGAVLEVISYNEVAGRFEFQVVRDYRPGGRMQVRYQRRALCLACHQNQAPMFARPLWDETAANPAIARRLRQEHRDFYGVGQAGTDVAYAIDIAAQRANLLPVWQRMWREACGGGESGRRCRAELYSAVLRYALSGGLPDAASLAGIEAALGRNWSRLWPDGLVIPNPDLPNRDPLVTVPADVGNTAAAQTALPVELARLAHIPAAFDPLALRSPLEVWKAPDPRRLIVGLAGMLSEADLDGLDRVLAERAAPTRRLALRCDQTDKAGGRRGFACTGADVHMAGVHRGTAGRLDAISLAGAPTGLRLQGQSRGRAGAGFSLWHGRRHARLADGRRLAEFRFDRDLGELLLADDFSPVVAALERMPLLAEGRSFPAWDGLAWLLADLGARPVRLALTVLPAPIAEAGTAGEGGDFHRYCGQCHDTADAAPPNFLHGDPVMVAARLAHCAPRIYYRLSMWDQAEQQRGKTPMPPLPALAAHGLDAAAWTRSEPRARLLQQARRLLPAGLDANGVLRQPFESLPACLPPTDSVTTP